MNKLASCLLLIIGMQACASQTPAPAPAPPFGNGGAQDWVILRASIPQAQAVAQLEQALQAHPKLGLMQRIDHHGNAAAADLALPPTTVLVFGNPALGTPLMHQAPNLALDLPQRMLIRAAGSGVELVYVDARALFARHGLAIDHPAASTINAVLAKLAEQALLEPQPSSTRAATSQP